jgi:hypothetical protein
VSLVETEQGRIDSILTDLNLPRGQWALSGSGVMFLHGIPREKPLGDLDVFLATRPWFDLLDQRELWTPTDGDGGPLWGVFTTRPDDFKRRCDPPYLHRVMHGLEVNIFFAWRTRGVGDIDANLWVHNAQDVRGWPCVPLRFLFDWKVTTGRAKDVTDVRLIAEYLEAQAA